MVRVFDEMLCFGSMVWPLLVSETTMSERRTLRIPANIGSEQSELNLEIHCEFPTVFAASLIHRNN